MYGLAIFTIKKEGRWPKLDLQVSTECALLQLIIYHEKYQFKKKLVRVEPEFIVSFLPLGID
jgi:hypothetical protein